MSDSANIHGQPLPQPFYLLAQPFYLIGLPVYPICESNSFVVVMLGHRVSAVALAYVDVQ